MGLSGHRAGPRLLAMLSGALVVWGREAVLYGCVSGVFGV